VSEVTRGYSHALIERASELAALETEWSALVEASGAGLFLSPRWVRGWWRAYAGVDELRVLVLRQGARLAGLLPLYLTAPRSGPLKASELRMVGDLGGTQQPLLCADADLDGVVDAIADWLAGTKGWDVLDLPVRGRLADRLESAIVARGLKAQRSDVHGRLALELPSIDQLDAWVRARRPARSVARAVFSVERDAKLGLDELLRLCRKEWAAREEVGPAADPQAVAFLGDVIPGLCAEGLAHFGMLRVDGRAVAADLVVAHRDGFAQLLRGVDPELEAAGALADLLIGSVRVAVEAGGQRFAIAAGPGDQDDVEAPLHAKPRRGQRLRAWSHTTRARLHRGVASLSGVARSIEALPSALEKLRGRAPDVVQRAMARVAAHTTLHLYRGELFTRDLANSPELSLTLLSQGVFEALSVAERDDIVGRLDLSLPYCLQKWQRGDLVVLATVAGRPAGIVWCARSPVYVPDIAREVRPLGGECYIHDVYVHPAERGRQVAPAMLDFLAGQLRARDIYRAWALIERSNTASTRAFEKAAYASVADVGYTRVGLSSRLTVRPPDPEARAFLGLPPA
jgi:ribosomal protein S18 acetylase RimI-like enzyme